MSAAEARPTLLPLLQDEVKALGRLNTAFFLVGFLGFLTTWILDMIYFYLRKTAVKQPNEIIKALFSAFAPQYLLSRSLYDISQTYVEVPGRPSADPFTYAVTGRAFVLLALQAAGRAPTFQSVYVNLPHFDLAMGADQHTQYCPLVVHDGCITLPSEREVP